tara:strand:- start:578 stop:895 length:318 start_codon:yes stop_codon:yes gene_type:complete
MENIKIIRYDEYRYRIQTHVDGIYDMSEPMEIGAILRTLKRSKYAIKKNMKELQKTIEYWERIIFDIGAKGYDDTLIPLTQEMKELQAAYNKFGNTIQEVQNEKK